MRDPALIAPSPPDPADGLLRLAHCDRCSGHTFPASSFGCRLCGAPAEEMRPVPLPGRPRLVNFVTLHVELAPGLPVPCVVGEVELAPGLVEEAMIDVMDEAGLEPGMALQAVPYDAQPGHWRFTPVREAP